MHKAHSTQAPRSKVTAWDGAGAEAEFQGSTKPTRTKSHFVHKRKNHVKKDWDHGKRKSKEGTEQGANTVLVFSMLALRVGYLSEYLFLPPSQIP